MAEINLAPAFQRAAKIIRSRLLLQVPRDTGNLARSINVFAQKNGVTVQFAGYGIYTDMGTGPFRVDEADKWEGYKEVKGGVFAQEWTALPETDYDDIELLITKEIDKAFDRVELETEQHIIQL
jgi:hypothetical protein